MTLKIISGDNPVTVSHIAHQAGFADYQSYIDCSKVSDKELEALAEDTAIFGRVSPHQKKLLIQTLNANGHTTAMTGDGVNDILALREADCSIVMAEGDPATRQIANLVLMDSEFKDIPEILFEGRRVVNNIAHIAPIFLIKTVYSFLWAYLYCQYCFWKGRVPLGLPVHSGSDDFSGAIYRGSSTIYFDLRT